MHLGVIYDPEGLDRKELTRLAIERSMVCGFDASQLSGEGFKVMVEDQDVTLPNGELVENGLSFRNG